MIIAIASGKGGTGKTTVAVNLALSLENVQVLDTDVEEPNANVLLHANISEEKDVIVSVPKINDDRCTYCGKCSEFCAYNALAVVPNKTLVFPDFCHSCKGCALVCPEDAIDWKDRIIGKIKKGESKNLELVEGDLNLGESMAILVIKAVKRESNTDRLVIIDAPPGTSCPVMESIEDCDFVVLVTEPTPFGLHDLKLMVDVVRKLNKKFGVVINRSDVGDNQVKFYCQKEEIPILMMIPHQMNIASLYSDGEPFVLHLEEWKEKFIDLKEQINNEVFP